MRFAVFTISRRGRHARNPVIDALRRMRMFWLQSPIVFSFQFGEEGGHVLPLVERFVASGLFGG